MYIGQSIDARTALMGGCDSKITICCGKGVGLSASGLLIGLNTKQCLVKSRKCKLDIGLKVR